MNEIRVRSIEEAEQHIRSLTERLNNYEETQRDHGHRFNTLQSWWFKRLWWWIDGWPLHDLNGTQKHRPWHRGN